jgi:DNA-binding PadR family transcriptional regulator
MPRRERVRALRERRARTLSELEGCILGSLWLRGPSTPYAVRRVFLDSPSWHWSGSAGAVYPALRRLERWGLVDSVHAPRGDRKARRYELTRKGRNRFLAWLEPPFGPDVLSLPPDPVRTRMSFITVLSSARRAKFFAASVAGLRKTQTAAAVRMGDDEAERWARSAASDATRARIAWLEHAHRQARRNGRPRSS